MINLMGRIYIDHLFAMSSVGRKVVLVDPNYAAMPHYGHNTPLETYASLEEIFERFGDIITFVEYLYAMRDKVIIHLNEDDYNQFYVGWLKAVYPQLRVDQVRWVMRTNTIVQKYIRAGYNFYSDENREHLRNLTTPTLRDVQRYLKRIEGHGTLQSAYRSTVCVEFLLANYLAGDRDPHSACNVELVRRVEKMLLKNLTWELDDVRRELLCGLYRMSLGATHPKLPVIDLDQGEIGDQINSPLARILFDTHIDTQSVETVKKYIGPVRQLIGINNEISGRNDELPSVILDYLSDRQLTFTELERLLELDRQGHSSHIFGRSEYHHYVNAVLIDYFYATDTDLLKEFRL